MQCTAPENYTRSGLYILSKYPCGKCLACRTNLRREWASRLLLEAQCWHNSLFFTLTYADAHIPKDGLLSKKHIRNFRQNFTRQQGHAPRYFIAGEYGPLHGRPHYHGILFGEDPQHRYEDAKLVEASIQDAWQKGYTDCREFQTTEHQNSIVTYVAGYVLKETWKPEKELNMERKEWAVMSRRPPIGSGAAEKIAHVLTTQHGVEVLARLETAPATFKYGGRSWIMPYQVRKKICGILDIPFKPLSDTIAIELNTGLFTRAPEKKTYEEARAAEKSLATRLYTKANKHTE